MEKFIGKENNEKWKTVAEVADSWGLSERSVRNYCAEGRVEGAKLAGKTWLIPANAAKPASVRGEETEGTFPRRTLLEALRDENKLQLRGGIYYKVQIELTYNSNHIEGSRLTHDQTRYIYETNTVTFDDKRLPGASADDVVETVNHFRAVDLMIDQANRKVTESMLKRLHLILKNGTSDSRKEWFAVGKYKKLPNEVGGKITTAPEDVPAAMAQLLEEYHAIEEPGLEDVLDFHVRFEEIHPFQDGNGRVGRLIMFKECLRLGLVPFIIDEQHKMFYYRGLHEWKKQPGFLTETCASAQDEFLKWLNYFEIEV